MSPHLFDKETKNYTLLMAKVDALTEADAKRELKLVLDALWGEDAGEETPRYVNSEVDHEALPKIVSRLEDLMPDRDNRDGRVTCDECGLVLIEGACIDSDCAEARSAS